MSIAAMLDRMVAPGFENKVMHASLCIGDSVVMASDGQQRPREVESCLAVDHLQDQRGSGQAVPPRCPRAEK
jgi:uncharacterized glyoxalase superfamily protein PhnB